MIIKRLRMENIRSYKGAEVEFPRGRTLFVGDIGSGKSTILMAVEFALFGLGSAKASSLLRVGESKGAVELDFEANGGDYWVRRTLAKKGTSIQQVEGKLRGPMGEEEEYPASEMKERMLGILNFREPTDPKSRSLIYQYAVYTPQEEMKQILALRPDLRLQILRRAFGVEEYKLAMENAKELLGKIDEKKVRFEDASRDIPVLTKEMKDLMAEVDRGGLELVRLEKSEQEEEKSLQRLEREKDELHEVEIQLASARQEQVSLKREINQWIGESDDASAEISRLEQRASQLETRVKGLMNPPTEKSQVELKALLKGLDEDIRKHEARAAAIETKIEQYDSVAENGKCPICDRKASPEKFKEKVKQLSTEKKTMSAHLESMKNELQELDDLLEKMRGYDDLVKEAKGDTARIREYGDDVAAKKKRTASLEVVLEGKRKSLSELEKRIRVLEEESEGLKPLNRKIESSKQELKSIREKTTGLRKDLRNWSEGANLRAETIARKDRMRSNAGQLGERRIWLEEYFLPTVESIERHIMTSINREFGYNFQKWFSTLVEDGAKEARVDEDFTPLVDQEGYEQDIEFLSGGERTSVALAYRLALSQMVQKFAEVGPNSLILDEPTDGFSKEQLGKMREILDEMANPQVVIVSHERELESMADQIYRVAKVDGESKISR